MQIHVILLYKSRYFADNVHFCSKARVGVDYQLIPNKIEAEVEVESTGRVDPYNHKVMDKVYAMRENS